MGFNIQRETNAPYRGGPGKKNAANLAALVADWRSCV
jgi:hypothetical protein